MHSYTAAIVYSVLPAGKYEKECKENQYSSITFFTAAHCTQKSMVTSSYYCSLSLPNHGLITMVVITTQYKTVCFSSTITMVVRTTMTTPAQYKTVCFSSTLAVIPRGQR